MEITLNKNCGLYIHVPFCRKRCNYCNFFFTTNTKLTNSFVEALILEMSYYSKILNNKIFDTIYFGGGTPSVLHPDSVRYIINQATSLFNFVSLSEVTLECNPEDMIQHKASDYRAAGVNRLSIGIQSFNTRDLKFLTRQHTPESASRVISEVKESFDNFTLDLIYSLPEQTLETLEKNICSFINHSPPHISAYLLTYEDKTPLFKSLTSGHFKQNSDDKESEFYLYLSDRLRKEGYIHYEVSSFCKPGFEAKHNSKYWLGNDYLGLGPAAHSLINSSRFSNLRSVVDYCKNLGNGKSVIDSVHKLFEREKAEEEIMLKLRSFGISNKKLNKLLNSEGDNFLMQLLNDGYAIRNGEKISLTPKGFLISDTIISKLTGYLN